MQQVSYCFFLYPILLYYIDRLSDVKILSSCPKRDEKHIKERTIQVDENREFSFLDSTFLVWCKILFISFVLMYLDSYLNLPIFVICCYFFSCSTTLRRLQVKHRARWDDKKKEEKITFNKNLLMLQDSPHSVPILMSSIVAYTPTPNNMIRKVATTASTVLYCFIGLLLSQLGLEIYTILQHNTREGENNNSFSFIPTNYNDGGYDRFIWRNSIYGSWWYFGVQVFPFAKLYYKILFLAFPYILCIPYFVHIHIQCHYLTVDTKGKVHQSKLSNLQSPEKSNILCKSFPRRKDKDKDKDKNKDKDKDKRKDNGNHRKNIVADIFELEKIFILTTVLQTMVIILIGNDLTVLQIPTSIFLPSLKWIFSLTLPSLLSSVSLSFYPVSLFSPLSLPNLSSTDFDIPFPYLVCLYLTFTPFRLIKKLRYKAFSSVVLLIGLLLIPTMNFIFIQLGSGNANYLYFQSIVYMTAIHLLGVQSIGMSVEVMMKLVEKKKRLFNLLSH